MFRFILLACVLISHPTFATESNQVVKIIQEKYKATQSWEADFVQTTQIEILETTVEKEGQIKVKKPGKLWLDYAGNEEKQYVSNGKKMWVFPKQLKQVTVFEPISPWVAPEALSFLHGFGNLEETFLIKVLPKKQNALQTLELKPKNPDSPLEQLILGVDTKTGIVESVTLINESGNQSEYRFKNIHLNTNIPDSVFEFQKPSGVREIKG